ncbi:MAG: polysaccharide biosynthesis tyrosine autokinase [Nitrospinota bacterium]
MGNNLEQEIHLRDYWRVILKRKWTIITFFIIVVTTVTIHTFKMRPVYQAATRILIDKENPNVVSFEEVMKLNATDRDYYQTQYKILQSRQLIEKVIKELNLKNSPEFLPDPAEEDSFNLLKLMQDMKNWLLDMITPQNTGSQIITDPRLKQRENIFNNFSSRLKITPIRNSRLVDVSFTGYHPGIITNIANIQARLYIDQNLDIRLAASEDAVQWLNKRIKTLREKVANSEIAVQRYKKKVGIVSFEERQNIVDQKLAELNTKVTNAKTKRIERETLYNQLKRSSKDSELVESLPTIINNSLIQTLKIDLSKQQGKYSKLSERYGRRHPKIVEAKSQIETISRKINREVKKIHQSIYTEYQVALAAEKSLVQALNQQKGEASYLNEKSIRYGALKRESESNRQMYGILLKRMKETGLSSGLRSNNIRIIDPAVVPQKPIKPNKKLNILLAVIVGLFMGTGLAFFIEYLDNTVKEPDEIPVRFQVPFLGLMGRYASHSKERNKSASGKKLVTLQDPSSNISESIRTIRTNVVFCSNGKAQKTIMVTSAVPAEGKSTIASNLAVVMASLGEKILLIDADLRKPALHKLFNIKKAPGLSNYLIEQNDVKEVVKKTDIKNLLVIPSGPTPPNPSELLSRPQFKVLCDTASQSFDRIIIDSSPVASVSDPAIISTNVNAVILVIRCGVTTRDSVTRAARQLRNVQANIIGAVLNDVDFRKDSYYYQYYYKHYYYKEGKEA